MIDNRKDMSCQEFSACMADLIASGQDLGTHPHVRRCKLHRALLEDLESIARAARQLFPEIDPADSVWEELQARLAKEEPGKGSNSRSGYRVVTTIRVKDESRLHRGWFDRSDPGREVPVYLRIEGTSRSPARREGRR